jgi:hypothetical protein
MTFWHNADPKLLNQHNGNPKLGEILNDDHRYSAVIRFYQFMGNPWATAGLTKEAVQDA